VFTSHSTSYLVHLAMMLDANAVWDMFFYSDEDWSNRHESDAENKEKLQALKQKMAELQQALGQKIIENRSKVSALQFLVNSDSSTEELKKKAWAMLLALFKEALSATEEKERKRE